ncbi:MAG: AI-2E family transporter [Anaerolineae bacterium]|nr:AI-2E family transporter [Anaerolineae bacterium]
MSEPMIRPMNLLLAGACLFIIMFGIKATAVIINPILLAVIITIAVLPMPNRLRQRGMSGRLALLLTILAVVGVMLTVILLFVGGLHRLSVKIPTYADDIAARSAEFAAWFEETTTTSAPVDSQQVSSVMTAVIGAIGGIVVQVFMTLLIFIFMISAAITGRPQKEVVLATAEPVVNRVNDFTRDVRQYLTVTTVINMLVGLGDAIFLLIMGVDFAILWGVLAWLLGYIPTIGFWLALIPPTILAWAEHGVTTALIVFAGFVLINGSVQNFIQPKMMGDNLHISPVIVFLSLFIWGWLLGGIGAILAVPLTLLILALLESFEGTRGMVMLVRPSTGSASEADEAEKQKARQLLGNWWERGKSMINPKSYRADEE